jgi:hypothetical protein
MDIVLSIWILLALTVGAPLLWRYFDHLQVRRARRT